MNLKLKISMFIISFILFGFTVGSVNNKALNAQEIPDIDELLTKIDAKLNFGSNSYDMSSEMSIVHKDTDGTERVSTSIMYRKNRREKFMVIFTSPIDDVGSGYLKVENNLWYYDAQSREWIKKTYHERFANSNVEAKDIDKNRYKPYFDWEYFDEQTLGKIDCYVLVGKAKFEDFHYPIQKVWISKDNYLPLKEESYTVSNVLVRTTYMLHYIKLYDEETKEYTYIDDKRIIIRNIDKTQSIREMTNISLKELPDNMFTKSYFEQKNGG